MENPWSIFLISCMVLCGLGTSSGLTSFNSFNVVNYGAAGDGKTDDSQAFLKAWKSVCNSQSEFSILIIPKGRTFLLNPATFSGPCRSSRIYVQVSGNIVAPDTKWAWIGHQINTWLVFSHVNGLFISGKGQIDGQGSAWWQNPCLQNVQNGAKCSRPTALTFNRCDDLVLNGLTHINSPRNHISINNCKDVIISNLHIRAPQTSPNTDGIDIAGSSYVRIRNCIIGTGDDCIAIGGGSSNVNINGVTCGPGHGISIGSLGRGGYDTVEDIQVRNCTFEGTMNGVRIKTWQGGAGYARRISFQNIRFVAVDNPIIIDQFYCPNQVTCQNKTSAVELSEIRYSGILGTSTTDNAINLSCSQSTSCTGISIDHVYITSANPGEKTYANCFNAYGRYTHTIPPVKCLLQ